MGREIKRVPLDFQWELNKIWDGYLNPHPDGDECETCNGDGYSEQSRVWADKWYGKAPFHPYETGSTPFTPDHPSIHAFAQRNMDNMTPAERVLVGFRLGIHSVQDEAERLCYLFNKGWCNHLDADDVDALWKAERLWDFKEKPTPQQVNEANLRGMGHDSINFWTCLEAKCERLGVPRYCLTCNGDGVVWSSDEAKSLYESWEPTEPPSGEGWQLWENVTEGSPQSPVFEKPEQLVEWMTQNGYDPMAAHALVKHGYAPSAIAFGDGEVLDGASGLARIDGEQM